MFDAKVLDMQSFSDIHLMAMPLTLFAFMGETRSVANVGLILFRVFNYCVGVFVLFFVVVNFYFTEGVYYVKTIQSLFFLSQFMLKYFLLIKHKSTIQLILANIGTRFWDYRGFHEQLIASNEEIFKTVKFVQTLILSTALVVYYSYLLRPYFDGKMAVESYIPRSDAWDVAVLISQYYICLLALLTVMGYDCVYVGTSVHLVLQLRLLKRRIQDSLDQRYEGNRKFEICDAIQHHQFLYSVFLQMKEIYSAMLLYHYMVTLISTCSVLLELILTRKDFLNYIIQVLSMTFFIVQFAMYAFPAEQITFEFSDIANAIYSSKWYGNGVDVQSMMLYVMMKAQRQQYFTGAGLIDINVEAFESVLRKSFSFFAVFRNLLRQ
ncbi:hypothetical protein Trydic_g17483 [Trypoxylus dichotomus]